MVPTQLPSPSPIFSFFFKLNPISGILKIQMFAARSVEMLHKTATAHERASTDCIMHARARLTVSTISGKKKYAREAKVLMRV